MYLVHVETYNLHNFIGDNIPPYAILSHRWGPEELTFKDILKQRANTRSRGYRKLVGACSTAKLYHVDYIWVDTCSIDKKSSAELSEAINSMFQWYQKAKVCPAFLEDIEKQDLFKSPLTTSTWFTRAWTLQELLAPEHLGSKASEKDIIAQRTRIPTEVLEQMFAPEATSWTPAARMSWASGRQATRKEDIAYSLMGMFAINMPLLYGEGARAFGRLQEEIIRRSEDLSLLLYGPSNTVRFPDPDHSSRSLHFSRLSRPLFARGPSDFHGTNIGYGDYYRPLKHPCTLNNVGLEIKPDLEKWDVETYAVRIGEDHTTLFYLLLQKTNLGSIRSFDAVGCLRISLTKYGLLSAEQSWRQERSIVITRGLQHDPPELFILQPFSPRPTSIIVKYEKSVVVTPMAPLVPSTKDLNSPGYLRNHVDFTTLEQLRYDSQTARAVHVLRVLIGQPPFLWIDICLDFDNCICIHIRTFERPLKYLSTDSVTMAELCDREKFPRLDFKDVTDGPEDLIALADARNDLTLPRERGMVTLPDYHSGLPTYFVRCLGDDYTATCCQVPGTSFWLSSQPQYSSKSVTGMDRWELRINKFANPRNTR